MRVSASPAQSSNCDRSGSGNRNRSLKDDGKLYGAGNMIISLCNASPSASNNKLLSASGRFWPMAIGVWLGAISIIARNLLGKVDEVVGLSIRGDDFSVGQTAADSRAHSAYSEAPIFSSTNKHLHNSTQLFKLLSLESKSHLASRSFQLKDLMALSKLNVSIGHIQFFVPS